MTDLEPWELLAERVVGEMNTSAGLARHTPVTNGDGASISQVHHKRKRPGSAPGAGSQLCASENASDMAIEIEGDRLREDAPWERNNQDDMQSFDTLAGDALNRGAEDKPEEKLAPRAAAIVAGCNLKKEMEGRVDLLFPTAATEPRASGRKPLVSSATKRIMQAAWEVMDALPACLIGVLSHSFGNFDRVVGCGWLLADVVDVPPIDRSTAHAVGLKARTQTLKLKTKIYEERKAPLAAARKLEDADPKRQDLLDEADRNQDRLLSEPIDLPFYQSAPEAGSSATGSRKRARDPEPRCHAAAATHS